MVITGELANLIDAIQANAQKVVEINNHPTRSLNNITSESSDRNKCQDKDFECPYWKDDCFKSEWKNFMKKWCQKTCGYCPEEGTFVHNLDTFYLINDNSDL